MRGDLYIQLCLNRYLVVVGQRRTLRKAAYPQLGRYGARRTRRRRHLLASHLSRLYGTLILFVSALPELVLRLANMNITLHGVNSDTVDEVLGDVVETARMAGAEDINVYAEAEDLPLLAAAAAKIRNLPAGFQLHELVPAMA